MQLRDHILGAALVATTACNTPPSVVIDAAAHDTGSSAPDAALDPGVSGRLADEADQPIGGEMILACTAATCYFGETEADGRFFFPIGPPTLVALKTLTDLTTTPRRGSTLCPVRVVADVRLEVGTLYTPNLGPGALFQSASADPQTLAVGDGLEITLRRGDLQPSLGDTLVDAAARKIAASKAPRLPDFDPGEIVAIYALHPFSAKSSSPIAVRAPSTLPAGTVVAFRTISSLDGAYSAPVAGHADGAFVSTDPSVGITELTWLVITR